MRTVGQLAIERIDALRGAGTLQKLGLDAIAERAGLSRKTLQLWRNGRVANPSIENIRNALVAAGLDSSEATEEAETLVQTASERTAVFLLKGDEPAVANNDYFEMSHTHVKDAFGTFEDFLQELIRIDLNTLTYFGEEEEGTADYWAPFFENYPHTWSAVATKEKVVGYWHFISLSDHAFEEARSGKLVETQLTRDDIIDMFEPGSYKAFFSMIIVENGHRTPFSFSILRNAFISRVIELAKVGIFFEDLCAYTAISENSGSVVSIEGQGHRLCTALGMQRIGNSYLGEPIFYMSGSDIPSRGVLSRNEEIRGLYLNRFKLMP